MSQKILIVDDSSMFREMLSHTLKIGGYCDIIEAKDGVQALNKTYEYSFDLIITDVNMPNMDGLEFIKQVRDIDKYKKIPIFVLTTERDSKIKDKGKEVGATGWITKPLSNNVIEAIKMVLK